MGGSATFGALAALPLVAGALDVFLVPLPEADGRTLVVVCVDGAWLLVEREIRERSRAEIGGTVAGSGQVFELRRELRLGASAVCLPDLSSLWAFLRALTVVAAGLGAEAARKFPRSLFFEVWEVLSSEPFGMP